MMLKKYHAVKERMVGIVDSTRYPLDRYCKEYLTARRPSTICSLRGSIAEYSRVMNGSVRERELGLASQRRISSVKWRLERQAGLFNSAVQPSYKTVAVPPSPKACFGTSIFRLLLSCTQEEIRRADRHQSVPFAAVSLNTAG
jgi:hypothetical protein